MIEVRSLEESGNRPAFQRRVAIIGSGAGGLVAARYLKHHGFEPVIFEQDDQMGGQWNVRSPHSGVWPSMVTNEPVANLLQRSCSGIGQPSIPS